MKEKADLNSEEMDEKSKKMDKMLEDCAMPVLKDFAGIVGRDLTDEEKEKLVKSMKAYFMMSTLLLRAFI